MGGTGVSHRQEVCLDKTTTSIVSLTGLPLLPCDVTTAAAAATTTAATAATANTGKISIYIQ
jgi:hypothetical protein